MGLSFRYPSCNEQLPELRCGPSPCVARNILPLIHIKCQWLNIFLNKISGTYYGSEVVLQYFMVSPHTPWRRPCITLHVVHVPPPHGSKPELISSSINMLNFLLRVYSKAASNADRSP
jgi:hypothetical protein